MLCVPSFVIRYPTGFPDEVEADQYEEREGELIFLKGGDEVFRVRKADTSSIDQRKEG